MPAMLPSLKRKLNMPKEWKKRMGEQPASTPEYQGQDPREYESAMFAAELGGDTPTLDLHALTLDEAIETAGKFVDSEFVKSTEALRIIHGRGTQVLRKGIHEMLKRLQQKGLVAAYRDASDVNQQGGVTLVALHRIK